jgi:HEAT repeat protein
VSELETANDWHTLAHYVGLFRWKISDDYKRRKQLATSALQRAGKKGLDALLEELQKEKVNRGDLIEVIIQIGDSRAVKPLLSVFKSECVGNSSTGCEISRFFVRINATEAADGLISILQDPKYEYAQAAAAYGLGLLQMDETRNALFAALDQRGILGRLAIRSALIDSGTAFARSIVAQFDEEGRAAGPDIHKMSEADAARTLGDCLKALRSDDIKTIKCPEMVIKDIGEELCRRGGLSLMRKTLERLAAAGSEYRSIEQLWDGIGDWRG